MQPKETTWARVRVGDFIRAVDGKVWKVLHRREDGYWGLVTQAGEELILSDAQVPPAAKVSVFYLTQDELEDQLREQLGAELMAVKYDGQDIWHCGPWEPKRLEEMKSHLFFFHGVSSISANDPGQSAGMNTKSQLTTCHEAQHADPGPRWTPHVHETVGHTVWPEN